MKKYEIISATTDGTILSVSAKGGIQIGTRTGEKGNFIPIVSYRNISISIPIEDLPGMGMLKYIKQQVEEAYAELPDLTVPKQLIGKQWTTEQSKI